jgi:hypothetical protein
VDSSAVLIGQPDGTTLEHSELSRQSEFPAESSSDVVSSKNHPESRLIGKPLRRDGTRV